MAKTVDEQELRQLIGVGATPARAPSPHAANARYLSSLDGFNIKRPAIPAAVFVAERDRALDPRTPTGLVALDLADRLGLPYPATTPLVLARYARIRSGERLATELRASTEFYYALQGSGRTRFGPRGQETIDWSPGDVFCLPGGGAVEHTAGPADAVVWMVTNEPQLAHERCRPPAADDPPFRAVHYPAEEIRRRLLGVYLDPRGAQMSGKSVNFGSAALEQDRTTAPTLMLAMNSLLPGEAQRAHRHNAVAVTLVVAGDRCYSRIDGERVDWEPDAVMITPPTQLHSHHNDGDRLALFLIVQDGGLYYHCRTMGFSFE
jgi:gentisate 1,2-dioxygenase